MSSILVRTSDNAEKIVHETVEDGWEPHYAVIYGDCTEELSILARMLGVRSVSYL